MKTAGNSFYSLEELTDLGIKCSGNNIFISRKASIYGPEGLILGDNVRIDDFCIISGEIKLGSYIHISAYCALYGKNGIAMDDFSGLSPRVTIFSASDDFSGNYLTNPMVPGKYTNVKGGKVIIGKFVQVGSGSVIMPGITINTGAAVAGLSFVNKSINEWEIVGGIPAKFIKKREKGLLFRYNDFIENENKL